MENTDLLIIGGGINGAAIAADAAGRGLSVVLCEKGDIACATSSASSKLIHGGLRYLELYEFNLVRKALREREILMRKAPHLVTPLQFILPHEKHLRPAWMIRIGLFLYDHLSRKNLLPDSTFLNFKKNHFGDPLQNQFEKGFSYYDCFTNDARLTLLNALAAKEKGAMILTRHEFMSAQPENNIWNIKIKNILTQEIRNISAKIIINVAGPWVNDVQQKINPLQSIPHKLVKGSHIIVPKLYAGNYAYILQNSDERIVFTIPYQDQFTIIGTTDIAFNENLNHEIKISDDEEKYLCDIVNHYFKQSISVENIISSYAGVRCLQYENQKKLSRIDRDYKIQINQDNQPPLVTIIGGKLTTHRTLAEETVNALKPFFPALKPAWTANAPLPGGDFPDQNVDKFLEQFKQKFSWLPVEICERYVKNYGTRANIILQNVTNLNEMGEDFSHGFYAKELNYLIEHEWAITLDDVLCRRTDFGLMMNDDEKNKIASRINNLKS